MGAPALTHFQVNQLYSNDVISRTLSVGNAGGIRPSLNPDGSIRRLVLLTALSSAKIESENPYHDRIEGNVLVYTGKGLRGDQAPGGLNSRLVAQLTNNFPIWCFRQETRRRDKASGANRWKFIGLLTLLRFHQEEQLDSEGQMRSVWIFEFQINDEMSAVEVVADRVVASDLLVRNRNDEPDRSQVVVDERWIPSTDNLMLESLRSTLLALHPRQFEVVVKRTFDASGYKSVEVTRYSQDGGIDVVAKFGEFGWAVSGWQVQVQAKKWLHTVGRKEVAELRGSLRPAGLGCLITTSHFSRAAIAEASESGKSPIALIDGREFASLLVSYGIDPTLSSSS